MKMSLQGLRALGSKAGRLALAGCVVAAFAPGLAFAHYDYDSNSGMATIDKDGNDPLMGGVKEVSIDKANHVYEYMGYAHSDNGQHYKAYGLRTALTTDADGTLTSIDLTSGKNDTFAGMWGYLRGKGAAPIDGYLPDGVSFNVVANQDGTFTPDLTDKNYGMTLSSVTLISTNADGTKDATGQYQNETYNVSTQAEGGSCIQIAYTGDKTNIALPDKVSVTKLVRDDEGKVVTVTQGSGNRQTTVAKTETVEVDDSYFNLIKFTYQTASEKMPFDCYYCINDDANAEAYCDNCVGDKDGKTVYGVGTSTANRDGWTSLMGSMYLRMLPSWGATLVDPSLATGLDGEIGGVDTVSSATKTSKPFQQAMLKAFESGYVKGVSENLQITIDGKSTDPALEPININEQPQDATSVVKNDDGTYTVNLDFKRYGGGRLTRNAMFLFELGDQKVGTQGMMSLAKECDAYASLETTTEESESIPYIPAYKYTSEIKSGTSGMGAAVAAVTGSDDQVAWDFSDVGQGTITTKNKNITHIVLNYTFGHGDGSVAYDLEAMTKVPEASALMAAAASSDAESVAKARAAYDALPYDVRAFATGIGTLETAEAELVAAQFDKLSASDEAAVAAARAAYDKLDAAAKAKIEAAALGKLTSAEKAIADAKAAAEAAKNNQQTSAKPATSTTKASKTTTAAKKAQKITVKTKSKTFKGSKLIKSKKLKKKQTFSIGAKTNGKGKLSYKVTKKNKNIKFSKGKVTVKKGTKAGTYKIKVKVTAAAKGNYKKTTKTFTIKVVVKKK